MGGSVSGQGTLRQPLPRGASVGRYVLLDPLGGGAVGLVYAAHDPQLDRKVAIKLMQPEARSRCDVGEIRARMLREAKAIARVTHRNVVAVHDAGLTADGTVFIVMEFIEGQTVKKWRSDRMRAWREVHEVFVQAANGLLATHCAGLLHRDFKPENVLIGRDGRVSLVDFGLARSASLSTTLADSFEWAEISTVDRTLTRSGTLIGTPAYMSPEQILRRPADERSDQFSFCLALYETLYGERPFAGDTLRELSRAMLQGSIRAAPRSSWVPAWLREAVLRGLHGEPGRRYPSMKALLEALTPAAQLTRFAAKGARGERLAGRRRTAGTIDAPAPAPCSSLERPR